MSKTLRKFLAAGLALTSFYGALLTQQAPALAEGPPSGPETDQLIIKLRDPGKGLNLGALAAAAGEPLEIGRAHADGRAVLKLRGFKSAAAAQALAAKLARLSEVEYAEPDAWMTLALDPGDPLYVSTQWDLKAPIPGRMGANLPGAWDISTGNPSLVIAVIDTGIRPHADLAGRTVAGYDFINTAVVGNDGDGRDADASDPGDWVTNTEAASGPLAGCQVRNSSWHGTHVAGTIGAAANNAAGIAGINWQSKVQPVRVLGKCGGYTSDIADGMRWAAGLPVTGVPANATPARVLNLSLGGGGACSTTYQQAINAITAAGAVVVVAAGNSNTNASGFQPANCSGVITVASSGKVGNRASYSNYGSSVEITAQGGDSSADAGDTILSTLNTGTQGPAADSYVKYQGTSMAAPHVAGVASLILSINPALTPAQVLTLLQGNVTAFPSGSTCNTGICGTGILNAAAAVLAAAGASPTPTPTAVPPSPTATALPPTATPTAQPPTATPTALPPTETPTALPPTATPTETPTALPPTDTPTALPPTATPTETPTALPPTETPTALPPTATPTETPTQPPPTATPTQPPPTPTATPTQPPPTPTATPTTLPPTPTPTPGACNEVEPNNSYALAQLITTFPIDCNGTIGAIGDPDLYRVNVLPGNTLSVTLFPNATSDYDLILHRADGIQIGWSKNPTGVIESVRNHNSGSTPLTVLLHVTRKSGGTGPVNGTYVLRFEQAPPPVGVMYEHEPNGGASVAQPITQLPVTIDGGIYSNAENDTFAVNIPPGNTLTAALTPVTLQNYRMTLMRAPGTIVANTPVTGLSVPAALSYTNTSATTQLMYVRLYYVGATNAFVPPGSYLLSLSQ